MKVYNLTLIICLFIFAAGFTSCKKSAKEVAEKIMTKGAEKSANDVVQETSEATLKTLTKKELRSIDWESLLKIIKKKNLNLADALSRLDGSFQEKIGKAIQSDHEFYTALISSNTLIDEFSIFTKNAPKAADNINMLKYFAKCRDLERRFGVPNALGDIALKEESGIIKIISNKSVIADMRDGIIFFKEPLKSRSNLLNPNSLLKKNLIPNSVYKIKGSNGLSYLYHVDDLGRLSKIEATGINANELLSNVIFAKENLNLGPEWASHLKKIKQTSKGNDISSTIILKYADDETTPLAVKVEAKVKDKKLVSQSFENLDNLSQKAFSTSENASLLDKYASPIGLSTKKRSDLLIEMGQDDELAKIIHSNPEFNIERWLKTRNHVDKSKVARTATGRMVPNGQVYAGNTYYFNPHLNSGLKARLRNGGSINLKKFGSLSYEDLIKLDKLYPDGVPFTKKGFPDFSKVAFKDKSGNVLKIDIKKLSGDSKKEIQTAETLFQKMGYSWESGYTWHHVENSTTLIRVPSAIHQLIDHAGGMSTNAAQQVIKQAA